MLKLVYLASPYNDANPSMRGYRYDEAVRACAWLMNRGMFVYSPIVHMKVIADRFDLPHDWEFWQKADTITLGKCDEMLVLTIEGWDVSRGVKEEITFAQEHSIPIQGLRPVESEYAFVKLAAHKAGYVEE